MNPENRSFVFAVAKKMLRNHEDAEDVTQEVLLLAHEKQDTFEGRSAYTSWLYILTRNTVFNRARKARRARHLPRLDVLAPTQVTRTAESMLVEAQDAKAIQEALALLSTEHRDALMARLTLTEPQAAIKLGTTVANVKSRAFRARKQMRKLLEGFV